MHRSSLSIASLVAIPGALACAALLLTTRAVATSREAHLGVAVETVNDYDAGSCGSSNLYHSDSSGSAFMSGMTTNADDFLSAYVFYQDGNVWPTDFQDPNLSGAPTGSDDTDNFDSYRGLAATFFQGHGGPWGKPNFDQLCTSQAQCITPPSGTQDGTGSSTFGTCSQNQTTWSQYGPGIGICMWKDARALVTCKNGTTGGTVYLNTFGMNTSYVALGETPYIGQWRGAYTNGGAALAVVKMSYGMLAFYPSEWSTIFGGLHIYAGVMVSWGDSEDTADFGAQVALAYTSNPQGSVAQGYVNAINGLTGPNDGTGCSGGLPGGFNGCGCHVAMTETNAPSYATSPMTESWSALTMDDLYQEGTGSWYFTMVCNYNQAMYPWQGADLYN